MHSGSFAPLHALTLDLKESLISVNGGVYLARDMDDLLKETSFGSRTTFHEMFKPVSRICRAIVMERLAPLRYVKCVDHFKQAVREIVLAHHLVFSRELRALHCDISIDSLMVRYCDTSTLCGVLIDFDVVPMPSEPTGDHTGTWRRSRPFMAWELLESDPPRTHLERFDWESFFYVICWIVCRYSEGEEVNRSALSHWYEPDDSKLASMKQAWIFGPVDNFTSFYMPVAQDWVIDLMAMFQEGRIRKNAFQNAKTFARPENPINDEEFDKETSGGPITWDRFWEILKK